MGAVPLWRQPRLLIALILIVMAVSPVLWWKSGQDERPVPTRSWADTLTAMDKNPDVLQAYLAERTVTRNGVWDYRWESEPFRHVWATLRFDRGLPGMPQSSPESPSLSEVAQAYQAMGLGDLADRILGLPDVVDDAASRRIVQGFLQEYAAASTARLAARKTYLETHRAQLDTH